MKLYGTWVKKEILISSEVSNGLHKIPKWNMKENMWTALLNKVQVVEELWLMTLLKKRHGILFRKDKDRERECDSRRSDNLRILINVHLTVANWEPLMLTEKQKLGIYQTLWYNFFCTNMCPIKNSCLIFKITLLFIVKVCHILCWTLLSCETEDTLQESHPVITITFIDIIKFESNFCNSMLLYFRKYFGVFFTWTLWKCKWWIFKVIKWK